MLEFLQIPLAWFEDPRDSAGVNILQINVGSLMSSIHEVRVEILATWKTMAKLPLSSVRLGLRCLEKSRSETQVFHNAAHSTIAAGVAGADQP